MDEIKNAIQDSVKKLFGTEVEVELTRPDEQFGDYATNIALKLAKELGKNPREVAESITGSLKQPFVAGAEVAGPGFINITLSDEALWQLADSKPSKSLDGKKIVAEYSDPNPFKVLHAGHLYTTITGDVIASLLENAGATVHRLNYGGDVGLHVGKSMWAIIKYLGGEHPEKLAKVPAASRLEWLSARYVEGNSAYEDDEKIKEQIIICNKRVYDVHAQNDQDSPFAKIYWACRQWSYDGFNELYKQLNINSFEKYIPESQVTPKGLEIVKKGLSEGVFQESDGAVVFKGEDHGLHTRVFLNSDGLPTYEAKDLGLAASKWEEYKFDTSVIITGNDIVEYMKVVLKALSNFYPEVAKRSKHLTHGMIKLPGGVKMSSRKGNVLTASDILAVAKEANITLNGKDNQDTVLAAVKYAFLRQRIGGDIIYDPNESVALEGNSGPYLQYAHARARSILSKSPLQGVTLQQGYTLQKKERALLRKIGEYAENVDKAAWELMPHHVCTYLYELAQTFNSFYEHNRVLDDPRQELRLKLIEAYAANLKKGLSLLNIPAPERM